MTGNIWMCSHLIDSDDMEFGKHEFITYKMGQPIPHLLVQRVTQNSDFSQNEPFLYSFLFAYDVINLYNRYRIFKLGGFHP